jgi:hypothetical protein
MIRKIDVVDLDTRLSAVKYFADHEVEGVTLRQVAIKFKVNYASLWRWVNKGIKPRVPTGEMRGKQKRYKCEHDLFFMARDILGYTFNRLTGKGISNPPDEVHREMVKFLESKERFKLGEFPRYTYKTTLMVICKSIQLLLQDPETTILIATEPKGKAGKILAEIKQHLEFNKTLVDLYGKFRPRQNDPLKLWNQKLIYLEQRESIIGFKEPSINTASLDADPTGSHPDWIFVDDIVIPKNITTPEQIQKVITFVEKLIHMAGTRGHIVIDGTPYTGDDVYTYIQDKWIKQEDPSTGGMLFAKKIMGLRSKKDGHSIMPSVFTKKHIDLLERTLPAYEFSCQVMCDPMSGASSLIPRELIENILYQQFDYKKYPDYQAYICVDPGLSENPKMCFTGITLGIPIEPYDLYFDYADRFRGKPEDVIRRIVEIIEMPQYKGRVHKVGIEDVAFQKIYKGSLRNKLRQKGYHDIIVKGLKADDNKNRRIYAMEPFFRHGQIHIRGTLKHLISQCAGFPNIGLRNRDMVDSAAYMPRLLPPWFLLDPYGIIEVKEKPVIDDDNYIPPSERAGYGFDFVDEYAQANAW